LIGRPLEARRALEDAPRATGQPRASLARALRRAGEPRGSGRSG